MTAVLRAGMFAKDAPNRKVADIRAETLLNLRRNAAIAVASIFLFDGNNKVDHFLGRTFTSCAPIAFVGIKPSVFSLNQRFVEL